MVRTQIQLTEAQAARVRALAVQRGQSVAEVIREAVDLVLGSQTEVDRDERRRRALSAIGSCPFGAEDIAERHDDYFADAVAGQSPA